MTPYYEAQGVALFHGDCLDVLAGMDAESVDAVVTDPPYGLEFMGRDWDAPWQAGVGLGGNTAGLSDTGFADGSNRLQRPNYSGSPNPTCRNCGGLKRGREGKRSQQPCRCDAPRFDDVVGPRMRAFQAWCERWAAECLRVLKPGGHLAAFGGTRTYHRLASGIEDAGFEVRDCLAWMYGSGFPKSLDVSKAIDKAAGAEREIVDSKLGLPGYSLANGPGNAVYGDGIGGSGEPERECEVTAPATDEARRWDGWGTALKPAHEPIVLARKPLAGTVAANVERHGTGALNIDGCRTDTEPRSTGTVGPHAESGVRGIYGHDGRTDRQQSYDARKPSGRWPANVALDGDAAAMLDAQSGYLRTGKVASHSEAGMWGSGADVDYANTDAGGGASRFFYTAKASKADRGEGNTHPTVKPTDLMRWLVRLVTPPGGTVLDPFAGSGTTGIAALIEGFDVLLIEREAEYADIASRRLSQPIEPVLDLGGAA